MVVNCLTSRTGKRYEPRTVAEENSDSRCSQQTGVPPRPWYAEGHSLRHHSPIHYSPHSTTVPVLLPRVRIRVTIRSLDTLYQEESSNPNVKQAPLRPSYPRTLVNRACTHSVYRTLRSPVSDDGPLRWLAVSLRIELVLAPLLRSVVGHCESSSSWTPSSARWLVCRLAARHTRE